MSSLPESLTGCDELRALTPAHDKKVGLLHAMFDTTFSDETILHSLFESCWDVEAAVNLLVDCAANENVRDLSASTSPAKAKLNVLRGEFPCHSDKSITEALTLCDEQLVDCRLYLTHVTPVSKERLFTNEAEADVPLLLGGRTPLVAPSSAELSGVSSRHLLECDAGSSSSGDSAPVSLLSSTGSQFSEIPSNAWMQCSAGYCELPGVTLMICNLPTRENKKVNGSRQYVDSVDELIRKVNGSIGEGSVVGAAFMGGNFAFAYVVMKDVATAQRIARQGSVLLGQWHCKAVLKQTVSTTSSLLGNSISSVGKIVLRLPWDGRAPRFVPSLDSVFAGECHVAHDCHTETATLQFSCLCNHDVNHENRKRAFVGLNEVIGGALLHYATFPKLNLVLSPTLDFDAALSMYPPHTKLYLATMWALLHVSDLGEVKLYGGCIRDGIVKGYLDEKGDIDVSYTANISIEAMIDAVNCVCETHRLPISLAPNAKQKENCHCAVARLTTDDCGANAATVDIEFTNPRNFPLIAMDLSFNNFELSPVSGLTQKYPGQGGLLMHAIHDSINKVGFIVNPEDSNYQRGRRCKRLADGYHLVNGDRHGGRLEGDAGDIPSTFDRAHALHLHVEHRCDDLPGTRSRHVDVSKVMFFGRSLTIQDEQAC